MTDSLTEFFQKGLNAFKNTDNDKTTHTHNAYLAFAAGCFVGGLIGPLSIPTAVGVTMGTVVYHEWQNQP